MQNMLTQFVVCHESQLALMNYDHYMTLRNTYLQYATQLNDEDEDSELWFFDAARNGACAALDEVHQRICDQFLYAVNTRATTELLSSAAVCACERVLAAASEMLSVSYFAAKADERTALRILREKYARLMRTYFGCHDKCDGASLSWCSDTVRNCVGEVDERVARALHTAFHFMPMALHVHKFTGDALSTEHMLGQKPLPVVAAEHRAWCDSLDSALSRMNAEVDEVEQPSWRVFYGAIGSVRDALARCNACVQHFEDDPANAIDKWYNATSEYGHILEATQPAFDTYYTWFARLSEILQKLSALHEVQVIAQYEDTGRYRCAAWCHWPATERPEFDRATQEILSTPVDNLNTPSSATSAEKDTPKRAALSGTTEAANGADGSETPMTRGARTLLDMNRDGDSMKPPSFNPQHDDALGVLNDVCGATRVDDAFCKNVIFDARRCSIAQQEQIMADMKDMLAKYFGSGKRPVIIDVEPTALDALTAKRTDIAVAATKIMCLMPRSVKHRRFVYAPLYLIRSLRNVRKSRARPIIAYRSGDDGALKKVLVRRRWLEAKWFRSLHVTRARKRPREQPDLPAETQFEECAPSPAFRVVADASDDDDDGDEYSANKLCVIPGCHREGTGFCKNPLCDLSQRSSRMVCQSHCFKRNDCAQLSPNCVMTSACAHCTHYSSRTAAKWHCAECWNVAKRFDSDIVHEQCVELYRGIDDDYKTRCPNKECVYSGEKYVIPGRSARQRRLAITNHFTSAADLVRCNECELEFACNVCNYVTDARGVKQDVRRCKECREPTREPCSKTTASRKARRILTESSH